ncbi:MAG: hypothetical protein ACR2K3_10215 [Nocardioides sp.]
MAVVSQPAGLPLWSDYVAFVRRHRAWIAAFMGAGLIFGYVWSLTQPTSYSATASVALTPVPMYVTVSTTELMPPPVSIDTDAQLLRSPKVLGAVATVLGKDEAIAGQDLSVSASPSTHVLHVTVRAGSAEKASAGANAAIAAFVQVRREMLGSLRTSQLSQLKLRIDAEEQLLNRHVVLSSGDDLFTQVFDLETRLQELEDARAEPANVIAPALVPRHADHANSEVPVVSGAMTGLLLAWLLGTALDRSRRPRPVLTPRVTNPFGDLPDAATLHESYRHAV